MSIRIVAIGKKHEPWVHDGLKRYQTRLNKPFNVEWDLLPHSTLPNDMARQEESRRIMLRLGDSEYVILLDERGGNISSPDFSKLLTNQFNLARPITIVIGGAFGVDESVCGRANYVWSLSKLVFPHQLVRLLLIEQLYRAQEIAKNGPYHHS